MIIFDLNNNGMVIFYQMTAGNFRFLTKVLLHAVRLIYLCDIKLLFTDFAQQILWMAPNL